MVFVRNNTETRLARMRQAAADIAAVLEPEDIRADFPSAATWYETLILAKIIWIGHWWFWPARVARENQAC